MSLFTSSTFFDLTAYQHAKLFEPCAFVWEALLNLEAYLAAQPLGKIEVDIPTGVYLVNPELISIGKGSVIEPGTYIQGPCILGEKCTVRFGAYIRGHFLAGNRCVIGHDTEVKHSIFLDGVHAAHFAYVGDSILGNGVNLGAGTKCANLKLDSSPVEICYADKRHSTGMRKLGAIVGDASQLGCNSVTNPGTVLGKKVFCHPCINVSGYIEANHVVKTDSQLCIKSLSNKHS